MTTPVFDAIRARLEQASVPYRHVHHEPTPTSEDSARARGEPLEVGGKALLLKAGARFCLLVISAARRADSRALRKALGVRKLRFASRDELAAHTGLVPGSVPPFGRPILPYELYVDRSALAHERIAFNAGSLTDSIILATADYRRVAEITEVVDVAQPVA